MEDVSNPEKVYAIRPNKSALKRDHVKIQKLAQSLIKKTPQALKSLSLNEAVLGQIQIAQKIKGSAYKRQIKHIANQLIELDEETLDSLQQNGFQPAATVPKKTPRIEQIALELTAQSNHYLEELLVKYPQLDRQKLRAFVLQIRREQQKKLPAKAKNKLQQYLHQHIQ